MLEKAVTRERLDSPSSIESSDWPGFANILEKWGGLVIDGLHTLHIYGAAGIVAFGWAMAHRMGFGAARFAPLWFCGALLVYNADRLRRDPADALNIPSRLQKHARFHGWSIGVAVVSAVATIAVPFLFRDPMLLLMVCIAAFLSLGYSFPLAGMRFKDVPVVKTIFAPAIVLLAVFLPPVLYGQMRCDSRLAAFAAMNGCLLLFNMILCDLRDIEGDRAMGVRSLPVLLGPQRTRALLRALFIIALMIAIANGWPIFAAAFAIALPALIAALRRPRGERFYEWFAEGLLFLPALVELGKSLTNRLPV